MQDIFKNFGIYLHVPFCAGGCDYCRFYKRTPTREMLENYVDAVEAEIALRQAQGGRIPTPQTMFWGGGTPSILSECDIERLRLAFEKNGLLPALEWTVEIAPANATPRKLAALRDAGVSRISMGVQSFDEKTLRTLGRRYSLKTTLEAVERVADAGFPHFSIDLIFGADGQTEDQWLADIRKAAECPVDHISAYCLEFESATSCCGGRLNDSEYEQSEREGDFLEIAQTELPKLGFAQYEISNYAKAGGECLHNLSTWNMAQWLGFGPAAASQWRGRRMRNVPDFDGWLNGIKNRAPAECDIVQLDDEEMFSSALIFGLRMNGGVDFGLLERRFPNADSEKYRRTLAFLESKNLLEIAGERIKLTPNGRLVADAVAVELL